MNTTKTVTVVSSPVIAIPKPLKVDWTIDDEDDLNNHNKLRLAVLYDKDDAGAVQAANQFVNIIHSIICADSNYESVSWIMVQYNLTSTFHRRLVCFHNNSLKPHIAKLTIGQVMQILNSNASVNQFLRTCNGQGITRLRWEIY